MGVRYFCNRCNRTVEGSLLISIGAKRNLQGAQYISIPNPDFEICERCLNDIEKAMQPLPTEGRNK